MAELKIQEIDAFTSAQRRGLSELLQDAVATGASVGFLNAIDATEAARFWQGIGADLGPGLRCWLATRDEQVAGVVLLAPCLKPNGRHRGEVQKLLTHRSQRRQGVATRLMSALVSAAREAGLSLLVLDTLKNSGAESLYQREGWQRAGEIPGYAAEPDGKLRPTVLYFLQL
ncbi:MAG: GNAT family N-acetyltransferase [Pseudomonadota bacterium]